MLLWLKKRLGLYPPSIRDTKPDPWKDWPPKRKEFKQAPPSSVRGRQTAGEAEPESEQPPSHTLPWLNMELETHNGLRRFADDPIIMSTIAGSVFALQNDLKNAQDIDIRAESFHMPLTFKGVQYDLAQRATVIMELLLAVHKANLEFATNLNNQRDLTHEDRVIQIYAISRSIAARLLLLSMVRCNPQAPLPLKLGVPLMWSYLTSIPFAEVVEDAKAFTGTFFENTKSDPLKASLWLKPSEAAPTD